MNIIEIKSHLEINTPIKERIDIFLQDVNKNIRVSGSGGSGKSSLLLNTFKG